MSKLVCAILGAGPGNGVAMARVFNDAGYALALCARSGDRVREYASGYDDARGYAYDVASSDDAGRVFAEIQDDLGPVDTVIYNAGSGACRKRRQVKWPQRTNFAVPLEPFVGDQFDKRAIKDRYGLAARPVVATLVQRQIDLIDADPLDSHDCSGSYSRKSGTGTSLPGNGQRPRLA